jgi:hypothetical protein
VKLIETSTFTKQIAAVLTDEEYGEFQSGLAANPQLGALIKGGGGNRKVRLPKRNSAMKREMFKELLESVREGGAILRGGKKARRVVIGASGVRTIREGTKLSQSEFAHLIGVSVKTLQTGSRTDVVQPDRQPPC